MAAKYWVKLYYDMLDDPKIGKLRAAVRWRFIECLLVAGECDDDGYIPDVQEYAWRVRADAETVETDFVALADAGLLSQDGGRWMVTNFAKRQAAVGSTERWRKWRDRQRKQEYDEQQTDFKRNQTQTPTNRLTDTDKIQNRIDKKESPNGEHPPETIHNMEMPGPPSTHNDAMQEMVSHLSGAVKDTLAIGLNEAKFQQVANALIDAGISTGQVDAFPAWWASNGHYEGRPALKSLLDNIRDAAVPVAKTRSSITDFKVYK